VASSKIISAKKSLSLTVAKNMALGAAGGLLASWAMNQFHRALARAQKLAGHDQQKKSQSSSDEPSTTKVAEKISELILSHELTAKEKEIASPIVHYAFGTTVGSVYGLLASYDPLVEMGKGLLYGTAVWLVADEFMLPRIKIAKPAPAYPLSKHLEALGAHLVYGAVLGALNEYLEQPKALH
jgi:hypothetical protein